MNSKTKFRILFVFLAIIVLWNFLPAQELTPEKSTLKQFIETALQNNEGIQIAMEAINSADAKIDESKSLYYPQASLSAGYTRLSLIQEFSMPLNGTITTFKFGSLNNLSLKLGVTEQVFNWGRTGKMVKMGEIGAELARENVSQVKQVVSYQLVSIFYGILFTKDAIGVLDDTARLFQQRLGIAGERYKAGLASDFDISLLQVQISSIAGQKLDLQNNIRKWILVYNKIAGRKPDAFFDPDDSFTFQPFASNHDELLREALANREEMKILEHQENLSNTQLKLAETGNKPTVVAMLNYEFKNGYMPSVNKIKGSWSAIISAAYPVFDGFKTKAQVAQSQSAIKTIEKQKSDLRQSIELEINQGLEDIHTIEQKLDIENIKIGHADTVLKIAEERFKNGLISTTDLIDAQTTLENAKLNRLQLVFNHILTQYNLFRAVGRKLFQ
jgi:outer membrane protein